MAQTIVIQGATYSDVPAVDLPTGNGTARFVDTTPTTATASDVLSPKIFFDANGVQTNGTLSFNWIGENPEYIKELYSLSTTLDQTSYASWTPSTTATTIKAAQTLSTTETLDLANYEYIMYWISDCEIAYKSTWSASKGSPLKALTLYTQVVFQRPSTVATAESETFNYTAAQQDLYYIAWLKYWSSSSAISMAYTTYSPCYISAVNSPTFSSTSSLTPTMTIKTPTLSARCSTTYFTTSNAGKVDQGNTTVKMKGYLYRVKRGSSGATQLWHIMNNVFNHPL